MGNIIIPTGQALIETTDAAGNPVRTPVEQQTLSMDEAKLLREFKKRILQKYGLAYRMDCRVCMAAGKDSEVEGGVMPDRIALACKHRMLTYLGETF